MSNHSKFSPSAAYRWTQCQKSIEYADLPTRINSEAERGTKLHKFSFDLFRHPQLDNIDTEKLLELYDLTKEEFSQCWIYVKYLNELKNKHTNYFVEQLVSSNFGSEKIFGTVDFIAYTDYSILEIVDFKTGFVPVDVIDNIQLQLYAILAIDTFNLDVSIINMSIVQPVFEPIIKIHSCTYDDLKIIQDKILGLICKKYYDTKPRPGSHCQYCPGVLQCSETEMSIKLAELEDQKNSVGFVEIDPEKIIEILDAEKKILKYFDNAKYYAEQYLENGGDLKHWTLVPKFSNRIWSLKDEKIEEILKQKGLEESQIWDKKIISPAQAEKLQIDNDWITNHTIKESTGKKLISLEKKQTKIKNQLKGVKI